MVPADVRQECVRVSLGCMSVSRAGAAVPDTVCSFRKLGVDRGRRVHTSPSHSSHNISSLPLPSDRSPPLLILFQTSPTANQCHVPSRSTPCHA